MSHLILEGTSIYDSDGNLTGRLELTERQKAGPFVICESATGPLRMVTPTTNELEETVVSEGTSKKHLMTLEGRFQMADTVNANGRIYPNSIWEKFFGNKDLQGGIDRGEMLGEMDHPKDGETRLSRVIGRVCKVWRNPNESKEILGRFVVFDNEAGRNLRAIVDGGGRVGVSSRGKGSVVRLGGNDVVQEDYGLQTWDVVHGPSTPGAYPEEVTESIKEPATKTDNVVKENQNADVASLLISYLPELNRVSYVTKTNNSRQIRIDANGPQVSGMLIVDKRLGVLKVGMKEGVFNTPPFRAAVEKAISEIQRLLSESLSEPRSVEAARVLRILLKDKVLLIKSFKKQGFDVEVFKEPALNKVSMVFHLTGTMETASKKPDLSEWTRDYSTDILSTGVARWSVTMSLQNTSRDEAARPSTKDGIVEACKDLGIDFRGDINECLKETREAYRTKFKVEGPLSTVEIDGISEAVKEGMSKAEHKDDIQPVIRAWIGFGLSESAETVIEARSQVELTKKIQEVAKDDSSLMVVNIDRSEQVYAECSARFAPLLEAQTLKAEAAARDTAKARAELTEMSAKLDAAKKLIEGLVARVKDSEAKLSEATADCDAACTIIDEMQGEVAAAKMVGAARVAIAVASDKRAIADKVGLAENVEQIAELVKEHSDSKPRTIQREPVNETQLQKAIDLDEKTREKQTSNKARRDPLLERLIERSGRK